MSVGFPCALRQFRFEQVETYRRLPRSKGGPPFVVLVMTGAARRSRGRCLLRGLRQVPLKAGILKLVNIRKIRTTQQDAINDTMMTEGGRRVCGREIMTQLPGATEGPRVSPEFLRGMLRTKNSRNRSKFHRQV